MVSYVLVIAISARRPGRRSSVLFVVVLLGSSPLSCGEGEIENTRPVSVSVEEMIEEQRTFVDTARATRANGTAPASAVLRRAG